MATSCLPRTDVADLVVGFAYIFPQHTVSICDDIVIADNHTDSLFVEISVKNGENLIVGVICRPPDTDLDVFRVKL